jgi:phosphatidylglycerophosphate synthase
LSKPLEVEEYADRFVHRPLAAQLIPVLLRSPVTPNQVTVLSGTVGVLSGAALAWGAYEPAGRLLGGVLLFVAVVLDCCDGQLARARGTFSTTGAVLDGLADYAVGISFGLGATFVLAHVYGSAWFWLLGLAGMVSAGVQMALFDHAKTRYVAQVTPQAAEREEDLGTIERNRAAARAAGRRGEAFLLWVYATYTKAQNVTVRVPPARDPAAYRAANRRRMFVWTFLGSGTHNAVAYLLAALSFVWLPALTAFFVLNLTLYNVFLAAMLGLERRQRAD